MALEKIQDFRGAHKGCKVFILASGPSLKGLDLTRLQRRIVIGLNRSSLVYPDTHYHCTMDQRLFDMRENLLDKTRFMFTLEGRPFGIRLKLLGSEGFSHDLADGIYSGYTVSYFALQLAVYMGFTEIFYVGLDLRHTPGHTHFFGTDDVSKNHEHTEFPKMARMLSYGATVLKTTGVKVYNTSPISTLDCFERVSFDWAMER